MLNKRLMAILLSSTLLTGLVMLPQTASAATEGWSKQGDNWIYYTNGQRAKGWIKTNGTWYYLNSNGIMLKNTWLNKEYYFDSTGAMVTGWQSFSGKWRYFGYDGRQVEGWVKTNGTWYYLKPGGTMAADEWVEGYYLDATGAMRTTQSVVGFEGVQLLSGNGNYYNQEARVEDDIKSIDIAGSSYLDMYKSNILGKLMMTTTRKDDYQLKLNGKFNRFTAMVGIDDYSVEQFAKKGWSEYGIEKGTAEVKNSHSITFQFIGDGYVLNETIMKYGDEPKSIDIDLSGCDELIIRVNKSSSIRSSSIELYYDILNGQFYSK